MTSDVTKICMIFAIVGWVVFVYLDSAVRTFLNVLGVDGFVYVFKQLANPVETELVCTDLPAAGVAAVATFVIRDMPRRQRAKGVRMICTSKRKLLELVRTLRPASRFARHLNRGKQQGDEDGDDRNHNQKLDECERRALPSDKPGT